MDFYPFTNQQLVEAGSTGFKDKNEGFQRFVRYLIEKFGISLEKGEEITENCVPVNPGRGIFTTFARLPWRSGTSPRLQSRKTVNRRSGSPVQSHASVGNQRLHACGIGT